MIEIPPSEAVHYLAQFKISAVFVIAPESGSPCFIGGAVDLSRALGAVAKRTPALWRNTGAPQLIGAWWADRAAIARVVQVAAHDLRGHIHTAGLIDADAAVVQAAILAAARRLCTGLAPHDQVMAKVSTAVDRIGDRVEGSRQNGTLSAFNAEFKRRRLEAQRTGARFPAYGAALGKLRRVMGEAAAAQSTGAIGPDVFRRVFGGD